MAYSFAGGTESISVDSTFITAYPFSMACWFQTVNVTSFYTLMTVIDKDVTNVYCRLNARGDVGGDPVSVASRNGGTEQLATTSTGYTANTWHHACGVWFSATDRRVYLNGGGKGTNATSVTAGAFDRTAVGRNMASTPSNTLNGKICEAAFWTVDLSDADALALANGIPAAFVRPDSLVNYLPLVRGVMDTVGGLTFTLTSATVTDHPRVFYGYRSPVVGAPPSSTSAAVSLGGADAAGYTVTAHAGAVSSGALGAGTAPAVSTAVLSNGAVAGGNAIDSGIRDTVSTNGASAGGNVVSTRATSAFGGAAAAGPDVGGSTPVTNAGAVASGGASPSQGAGIPQGGSDTAGLPPSATVVVVFSGASAGGANPLEQIGEPPTTPFDTTTPHGTVKSAPRLASFDNTEPTLTP